MLIRLFEFDLKIRVKQNMEKKDRNVGELLCLIHSEISEAMEGARKDLMDTHLTHRSMMEVELADAIIRILRLYLVSLEILGLTVVVVAVAVLCVVLSHGTIGCFRSRG